MLHHARALIAAAAVTLSLTACAATPAETASPSPSESPTTSATPSPTPTPTATIPAADSLDGIKVTGKVGESAKVEFDKPFAIDKTRVEVLKPGKGQKVTADGFVVAHYRGVNARTGETFDESYTEKTPATLPLSGVIPGFRTGLTGQQAGSRVLIAIPGPEGYDEAFAMDPQYAPEGYALLDTLLFVVDIEQVSLNEPEGKTITPPAGLPQVSSGTGRPTVTIPDGEPPTKLVAQTLIEGSGAKITAEDTLHARYVGVSWKTGEVFDDGFETATSEPIANLLPGWTKGLVGKTVGSRVLLVLPPADGYPEGSNNPPVEKGDTVVYVIDLLFAAA